MADELDLQYQPVTPPWVKPWGFTVACGEMHHDRCRGVRKWRDADSDEWQDAGPCTCLCHSQSGR